MAKSHSIAQAKYDSTHCKYYTLKMNLETDSDVIEKLSSVESKQGYIKQLIREDIARTRTDSVPTTPFGTPELDDETKESIADEIIRTCF